MVTEVEEYFSRCLSLLQQYQWLHDIKMTELLMRKPWMEMPEEWRTHISSMSREQLGNLPTCTMNEESPASLRKFLEECHNLTLARDRLPTGPVPSRLSPDQKRRLTAKKVHEIESLAPLINEVCQAYGCEIVVDLGCGIGYLAQILAENYGLKVLGIDCDAGHCEKAQYRAMSSDSELSRKIRYVTLKIGESKNTQDLEEFTRKFSATDRSTRAPNCALVSLHGCGDLQPLAYELFASSGSIKALMGVGCCYHKMTTHGRGFRHFPLSQCLNRIWNEVASEFRLSPYSMRLASQERLEKWLMKTESDRRRHTNFVTFRALIELLEKRTGLKIEKLHRHYFRDEHMADFISFSRALRERASFSTEGNNDWSVELSEIYKECKDDIRWVEPFTLLQAALAGVIEGLVLVDRMLKLDEQGYLCSLKAVFDPLVSPRNVVVLAEKT